MNLWWWRCFSYLKVCTSGTSLRLWPLILWTSLAAAFIIFSTLFSCCCSSRVWREQKQRVFIPAGQLYCDSKKRKKAPSGGLSVSSAHWEQTRTQTLISPRGQRLHGRPGHSAVSSPVSRPAWGAAGSVRLLGPRRAALSGPAASPSPAASSAPAAPAVPAPAEPAASGTPAGPAPGPERSAAARPDL